MAQARSPVPSGNNPIQNRFLHMEPVFGLVENSLRVRLESFLVDFLAAVRGQAVHHQHIRLGQLHKVAIDLVAAQHFDALCCLLLLAHRNPNVGVKQVGALRRGFQIFATNNFSARAF